MRYEPDGSILFDCGKNVFKFEADNYKKHVVRHREITTQKGLQNIELALKQPHFITKTPRSGQARYKILKLQRTRGGRAFATYCKVVSFMSKQRFLFSIATAFIDRNYHDKMINKLEKIIWKKTTSST